METGKKDWIKPELIIMVRSKPEEAVLSFCKVMDEFGPVEGEGDYWRCYLDEFTFCSDPSPS